MQVSEAQVFNNNRQLSTLGHLRLTDIIAGPFCRIYQQIHEGPPLPAAQVKHLHMGLEVGLHGLRHAIPSGPDAVRYEGVSSVYHKAADMQYVFV